jgi:hypothetical protein
MLSATLMIWLATLFRAIRWMVAKVVVYFYLPVIWVFLLIGLLGLLGVIGSYCGCIMYCEE